MNIVAVNAYVQRQFCAEMDPSVETPKENLTDVNCNNVEIPEEGVHDSPVEVWHFIVVGFDLVYWILLYCRVPPPKGLQ